MVIGAHQYQGELEGGRNPNWHQKDSELLQGISFTCHAKTNKDGCEVDTSLPFLVVKYACPVFSSDRIKHLFLC